jgi:uncharacterized phage protein gp47/JayE
MVYELYCYLDYISLQSVPFTATDEYLEAWANLKNVSRLDATSATGTVLFTGIAGTDIPAGTSLNRNDNVQYTTDFDWQVGSSIPLTFTAVVPAAAGNAASGIALSLGVPIAGVTSPGMAVVPVVGGADQELDASLRTRMLTAYASPPDGGSANDFFEWALQVPGVTRAWVVGQGQGIGSVLIYVMLDNTESAFGGFAQGTAGGATAETRVTAATGDMLLVANYIYPLRPVTSLVVVSTPSPTTINFTIQSLSVSNFPTQNNIIAALQDCFLRLGSPLAGNAIYPSDINQAIESASGVNRYTLISPVVPITVPVGSLPVVGSVVFS